MLYNQSFLSTTIPTPGRGSSKPSLPTLGDPPSVDIRLWIPMLSPPPLATRGCSRLLGSMLSHTSLTPCVGLSTLFSCMFSSPPYKLGLPVPGHSTPQPTRGLQTALLCLASDCPHQAILLWGHMPSSPTQPLISYAGLPSLSGQGFPWASIPPALPRGSPPHHAQNILLAGPHLLPQCRQ